MTFTLVVIGFYGSRKRHTEKYEAAWRTVLGDQLGTVILNPNPHVMLYSGYQDACSILEQLEGGQNVIFHVLSNRGMAVYLQVVKRLPSQTKVAGVVFDSCPGQISWRILFHAASANAKNSIVQLALQFTPLALTLMYFWRFGALRTLLVNALVSIAENVMSHAYHQLVSKHDPNKSPSLFLCTQADSLVSSQIVEKVAMERKSHIGQVEYHEWKQSGHVRLLQDLESEYLHQLQQFYQVCMMTGGN